MRLLIAPMLMTIALASCSESEPRSVEWFTENGTDREAVLADCARHAFPSSIECMNAQKAKDSLALKRRGYVRPDSVDFSKEE